MYEVGGRKLPEDILIEILFRLPVISLLKFKTVCKSWYSIIKSKHFIKKQLNNAQSSLYDQHKNVLGVLIPSQDGSNRCILYNQNSDGIMYAKQFGFPIPFKLVEVCNYCDGLICFLLSECDILLWNPSLPNEYNLIPLEYKTESYQFWVGIGYDSTTDDYKIVQVPEGRWSANSRDSYLKVFSMRNRSWSEKKIPKNFTYVIRENKSYYTQNLLHWCAKYYDGCRNAIQCIVYFDMVEEKLDVLYFPCKYEAQKFNYKDSLAIIYGGTLWVLEECNGMKNSWTEFKLPKFKYCEDKKDDTNSFCYCCFLRDGKILIQPFTVHGGRVSAGHGLRTYDPKDGNVRNVEIQGGDGIMYKKESGGGRFYASPYVESLISAKWFG